MDASIYRGNKFRARVLKARPASAFASKEKWKKSPVSAAILPRPANHEAGNAETTPPRLHPPPPPTSRSIARSHPFGGEHPSGEGGKGSRRARKRTTRLS